MRVPSARYVSHSRIASLKGISLMSKQFTHLRSSQASPQEYRYVQHAAWLRAFHWALMSILLPASSRKTISNHLQPYACREAHQRGACLKAKPGSCQTHMRD